VQHGDQVVEAVLAPGESLELRWIYECA